MCPSLKKIESHYHFDIHKIELNKNIPIKKCRIRNKNNSTAHEAFVRQKSGI